jgi:tetratricopeptide (TPR) repeat protein
MKRLAIVGAILLLTLFVAISLWKGKRKNTALETRQLSDVSAEEKAEILRFWDVYRRATDSRLEGAWEEASTAYAEALAIDTRHEGALYYSGNMFFELEKYDQAEAAWRRLIEVNPLSARAHFQLGAVYSCGAQGAPFDLQIAEREFQRALDINQEETGPILKLGELHILNGQEQQALTYLEMATLSNPKSVEAHYMIGYIKWNAGEESKALESLQRAATYARAGKPAGAPMGEGDTKAGSGPLLAEGASRKSLFAAHWLALKSWGDEDVSTRRMDEEYGELQRRLKLLVAVGPAE